MTRISNPSIVTENNVDPPWFSMPYTSQKHVHSPDITRVKQAFLQGVGNAANPESLSL